MNNSFNTSSILFIIIYIINLYSCSEIKVIRYLQTFNNATPVAIDYIYGNCSVINCSEDLLCAVPGGVCKAPNPGTNEKYECNCIDGYITHDEEKTYLCCYKQKNGMTALLLEFFIGFGVGHFYIGNYFIGCIKACVYLIFCLSSGFFLYYSKIVNDRTGKSFMFKVTRTICFLLCSCTYIGWQIVDCILFSIGGLSDGNGASLYI
jgi:hypothetical protein